MLFQSAVFANEALYNNNEAIKDALSANMYEPSYPKLIFGLIAVVALIYLTGIVYKKLTKINLDKKNVEMIPEIISSTSLGQNKNLYVVKLNSKYMLLGVTQNNISLIKDIEYKDVSCNA